MRATPFPKVFCTGDGPLSVRQQTTYTDLLQYRNIMNNKFLRFLIFFSLICMKVSAQDCDCLSQFLYIKNYIEANNPAFQRIKSNYDEFENYNKQVRIITDLAEKEQSIDRCVLHIEDYFLLLKDNHSGIGLNITRLPIDLNSQSSIDDFKLTECYRSFEKVETDTTSLIAKLESKPIGDIEGIYTNGGSLYFGIVKTKRGQYKGIVLRKTNLLDVGHVLMDIERIDDVTYAFTLHYGLLAFNFQNIYMKVKPEGGKITELGFTKSGTAGATSAVDAAGSASEASAASAAGKAGATSAADASGAASAAEAEAEAAEDAEPYEFRSLDSVTNYLRISSFSISLKQELELFYRSTDSSIQAKPYLIVDLRDNGGGAEECYIDLLKYFCTKPFVIDLADVWVSPDNIRKYESEGHPEELIERMKNATPFTFIPLTQNAITSWQIKGTRYPEKIAVIFNKKTASAAEGMIMYAMQSDKLITLGENSGGYLGYGNVKSETVPCGKFIISSTTTMYPEKSKYEFIGISPQIKLKADQDWVESATTALHKH